MAKFALHMVGDKAYFLDNRDRNGVVIKEGHLVRYGDSYGPVLIVHGPCPGARASEDGYGIAYVGGVGYWGDNRATECRYLEVI